MLTGFPTQKDTSWFRQVGTSVFTAFYTLGTPSQPIGVTATVVPIINTFYAVPFMSGRGGTLDRIAFEVTTGGGALSVGRCGIYTNNVSPTTIYPDALVVDGGEFDTTTTGAKTSTISVSLAPNTLYWAVFLCGVSAATIRGITGQGAGGVLSYTSAVGGTTYTEISATQTYGTLPATYPSGGAVTSATIPMIAVRYSG